MGVPTAVLRQRAQLEKDLGINPDGSPLVPDTPPIVSLVPSAPAPASAPTAVTPPAVPAAPDPQARVTELEQLLRTRDGQTSAAMREANEAREQMQTLQGQIRLLEGSVAELTKQKTTAEASASGRAAAAAMPALDDVGDLSPHEVEVFGSDSVEFVKKLSKRELLGYVRPLAERVAALETMLARLPELDKLPQIEKAVSDAQNDANRSREEAFFRKEILAHFPEFETARREPGWKDYLATDIPGAGIKIGHQLQQARLLHDGPKLRTIIKGYLDQRIARPSLGDLAVPSKTATEGEPVVKPRMKASDYKKNLRAFTGRKMASAEWDAFKTEFELAMQENRVDHDEKL